MDEFNIPSKVAEINNYVFAECKNLDYIRIPSTVGLVGEKETELAPRPKGIHSIGGYGKHKGKGDYWFYASETGRTSDNARRIRFSHRSGKYTMLTIGIRPVRALWRALHVALKKLEEGWFKTND